MSAAPSRTVLIVSAFDSPVIRDDAEILSGHFRVVRSTGSGPMALLRAASRVFAADIVYAWFLSVYGAVAVIAGALIGRPTVVVLGGVDVARDRKGAYGLWRSPWKAFLAKRALRAARLVLAVSDSLRDDAVELAGYDGANIEVLPTGYDAGFWTPGERKATGVLCVAAVDDRPRLSVKGLDVLVDAARRMPDTPFTVVGVNPGFIPDLDPPPNVRFLPRVAREDLLPVYRAAKVYCQPSRREGLPSALCEAMLCGCHPVVSGVGGMTEAVGEAGIVVPPGDHDALASALLKALALPGPAGDAGRLRIARLFPLDRRKAVLPARFNSL